DNNVAEREMKRITIGRKNWLTVGSPRGGQTAAMHFSFMSTCQRLGVGRWRYLRDVLERLPSHPPERLGERLPDVWARAQRGAVGGDSGRGGTNDMYWQSRTGGRLPPLDFPDPAHRPCLKSPGLQLMPAGAGPEGCRARVANG